MANQRKLGRTADQRKALLRNQVTNLIWYGRIETTEAKAKEVRRIADKMITLAVRECENTVSTTKETHNDKGQLVTLEVVNDAPSKLHARRLMMAYLYDLKEAKKDDENKAEYRERTASVIILSAIRRTSLALDSVVVIRPYQIRLVT